MNKPFKVFGIGLNKTGTSSLKQALRVLGYEHFPKQGKMTWLFFRGDLDEIYNEIAEFNAFEDWPWPLMYQQLFEKYGDNARFVLTRRGSPDAWLQSLKAHSLHSSPTSNPRKRIYGYSYPHGAEAQHMDYYETHLRNVRSFFERANSKHLLCEVCWEDGDGWQEVCNFLGEPMPERAFPHANQRVQAGDPDIVNENQKRIAAQLAEINRS